MRGNAGFSRFSLRRHVGPIRTALRVAWRPYCRRSSRLNSQNPPSSPPRPSSCSSCHVRPCTVCAPPVLRPLRPFRCHHPRRSALPQPTCGLRSLLPSCSVNCPPLSCSNAVERYHRRQHRCPHSQTVHCSHHHRHLCPHGHQPSTTTVTIPAHAVTTLVGQRARVDARPTHGSSLSPPPTCITAVFAHRLSQPLNTHFAVASTPLCFHPPPSVVSRSQLASPLTCFIAVDVLPPFNRERRSVPPSPIVPRLLPSSTMAQPSTVIVVVQHRCRCCHHSHRRPRCRQITVTTVRRTTTEPPLFPAATMPRLRCDLLLPARLYPFLCHNPFPLVVPLCSSRPFQWVSTRSYIHVCSPYSRLATLEARRPY